MVKKICNCRINSWTQAYLNLVFCFAVGINRAPGRKGTMEGEGTRKDQILLLGVPAQANLDGGTALETRTAGFRRLHIL
jgi:hypothetical protein